MAWAGVAGGPPLLSEREADAVLQAARDTTGNAMQASATAPVLLWGITSLCSGIGRPNTGGLPPLAVPRGASGSQAIGPAQLASVLGQAVQCSRSCAARGRPMMAAMSAAQLLVGLRGKKKRLERSDLEAAALQVAAGR